VGNKIDKPDDEEVVYKDALEYAQSVGALFKLTSAKDGKGINVFVQIFRSSLHRLLNVWMQRPKLLISEEVCLSKE
jgi:hypothetical protein